MAEGAGYHVTSPRSATEQRVYRGQNRRYMASKKDEKKKSERRKKKKKKTRKPMDSSKREGFT